MAIPPDVSGVFAMQMQIQLIRGLVYNGTLPAEAARTTVAEVRDHLSELRPDHGQALQELADAYLAGIEDADSQRSTVDQQR